MHLESTNARIYVAGHRGLVGSAIVRHLKLHGYKNLVLRTSHELDLRNSAATIAFFKEERPEFVVLAAARVGGILANMNSPVSFLEDNLFIQLNVIRAAANSGVQRLVFLGSSCIYPKYATQPMKEEHLMTGSLEPTNQWYAVAKIAGIKQCQAYRQEHGADFVSLMPTNLYGPGDNFDPQTSHVLPALIRKFHDAGIRQDGDAAVTLWGSGEPRREFLFSDDLAHACVFILEQPEERLWMVAPDGVLNVGVGDDLRISDLAALIRDVVGSDAETRYDRSKPDGTPRKLLDVTRMTQLGWSARTPLREGIERTYDWFLAHAGSIRG